MEAWVDIKHENIIDDILGIETDSQMGNKATKGVYCSQGKVILPLILSHQRIYRTRAIITRGLYTFYPLFEV